MRDLTYPPVIVAAKTGVPAARPALRADRHRARAPHRRRAARGQPHRLRRLRLRRPGRQPVRAAGPVHGQARAVRPPVDRPADALAAPHRGRPRRRRGVATRRRWTTSGPARRSASSPRPPSRGRWSSRSSRPARSGSPPRPACRWCPVILWGTQRMMTKDHPRDFSRGKTIAIRVGEPLHPTGDDPVAETAELHARDVGAARRGDPRPTPPTSSRPAPGGSRRRYGGSAPDPRGGRPARRRGEARAGRAAAAPRDAKRQIDLSTKRLCRH